MTTETLIYDAANEADTARLGGALAAELPAGVVVALHGTLGAGKTRLVQAVAAAWGIDSKEVISPTFVLATEHHGRRSLYHVDAYRLADEDEFDQLGQEEHFGGPGVLFIEWAERVAGSLPRERLELEIEVTGPTSRRFRAWALGDSLQNVIRRLQSRLAEGNGAAVTRDSGG